MGNHKISRPVIRGFGFFEYFLAQKRAEIANRLINDEQRKGRILDLGCGLFPFFLSETVFQEKYGLDSNIDSSVLKDTRISLKQINIEKEKIPFPNNYFNVITMLAVLEHIHLEKNLFVFKEIFRVLKSNGQLIVTTPSSWSAPIHFVPSRVNFINKVEIDDHKNLYNFKQVRNLLQKAGFSSKNIKNGFFELYLNMWFTAKKYASHGLWLPSSVKLTDDEIKTVIESPRNYYHA